MNEEGHQQKHQKPTDGEKQKAVIERTLKSISEETYGPYKGSIELRFDADFLIAEKIHITAADAAKLNLGYGAKLRITIERADT